MSAVFLDPESLFSKWGFSDGDIITNVVMEMPNSEYDRFSDWQHEHQALLALVNRYLLPSIPRAVEICFINTIHNPVRAVRLDGKEVDDRWYDADLADLHPLGPGVSVPWDAVEAEWAALQAQ